MNSKITADDRYSIVYDADKLDTASAILFKHDYWESQGSAALSALGRGGTQFINAPFGEAVLKQYLRGGQMARLNRDLYLYSGLERSRPFREFRLLAWMAEQQLPVPAALAAMVERHGLVYRGALITANLLGTASFSERLLQGRCTQKVWQSVGQCIRKFHDVGVMHADLNVNNILIDEQECVYLVDFDKGCVRNGADRWKQANLERLKRSLNKLPGNPVALWPEFLVGYQMGS